MRYYSSRNNLTTSLGETREGFKKSFTIRLVEIGRYKKKMSVNKNAIVEKQDLLCQLMPNKLSFKHEYKK
jgi:hypothetical protein